MDVTILKLLLKQRAASINKVVCQQAIVARTKSVLSGRLEEQVLRTMQQNETQVGVNLALAEYADQPDEKRL